MRLFSHKPKTSIEDFCREFYDSQIFCGKTGDEGGASTFWQNAFTSITKSDPSLAKVDRDLFRREMTALRMELFGLALVHFFEQQSKEYAQDYTKCMMREVVFTKSYLEQNGHLDIWEIMLCYNETIGDILQGNFLRLKDDFVERRIKDGIDPKCATSAANRFWTMGKLNLLDHFTATFAKRLGWHARSDSDAFLDIESLVSKVFSDAMCRLEIKVIDSSCTVRNKFYDLRKSVGVGLVWILGVSLFLYLLVGNPLHELALIQRGETVPGFIVETWKDRPKLLSKGKERVYTIKYTYCLPDGRELAKGPLSPDDYESLVPFMPYPIEVEYLPDKPNISRIKGSGHSTIQSWLIRKVGLGSLFLIALVSPVIYTTWKEVRNFRHVRKMQKIFLIQK